MLGTFIVVLFNQVFIGLGPRAVDDRGTDHARHRAVPARRIAGHSRAQLRSWRGTQKTASERRCFARKHMGGHMSCPRKLSVIRDKQTIFFRNASTAGSAPGAQSCSITDALIEEHRVSGGHSAAATRWSGFWRIFAVRRWRTNTRSWRSQPFAEYQPGRAVWPAWRARRAWSTTACYRDAEAEALHAVFLKRVQDLLEALKRAVPSSRIPHDNGQDPHSGLHRQDIGQGR